MVIIDPDATIKHCNELKDSVAVELSKSCADLKSNLIDSKVFLKGEIVNKKIDAMIELVEAMQKFLPIVDNAANTGIGQAKQAKEIEYTFTIKRR